MTSPVQTRKFDSRDPVAIHRFLASTYTPDLRIRPGEAGYHLVHQRVDTGPFALATTRQTAHLDIQVGDMDGLVVCRTRTAMVSRADEGSAHRFGPGDAFLVTRPGQPVHLRWEPGEVELCVLDLGVLTQVATAATARRPGQIRFTNLGGINAPLARQWHRTTSYVRDVVASIPSASAQPLVIGNAARMLAAAALAIFPNTAFTDETTEDRRDASSAADIASAAAVSAPPRWRTCAGPASTGPTTTWSGPTPGRRPSQPSRVAGGSPITAGSPPGTTPATACRPARRSAPEPRSPVRAP
ncbi:hypothetical protein OG505_12510 [Micromonospora sp. NBC_00617]